MRVFIDFVEVMSSSKIWFFRILSGSEGSDRLPVSGMYCTVMLRLVSRSVSIDLLWFSSVVFSRWYLKTVRMSAVMRAPHLKVSERVHVEFTIHWTKKFDHWHNQVMEIPWSWLRSLDHNDLIYIVPHCQSEVWCWDKTALDFTVWAIKDKSWLTVGEAGFVIWSQEISAGAGALNVSSDHTAEVFATTVFVLTELRNNCRDIGNTVKSSDADRTTHRVAKPCRQARTSRFDDSAKPWIKFYGNNKQDVNSTLPHKGLNVGTGLLYFQNQQLKTVDAFSLAKGHWA